MRRSRLLSPCPTPVCLCERVQWFHNTRPSRYTSSSPRFNHCHHDHHSVLSTAWCGIQTQLTNADTVSLAWRAVWMRAHIHETCARNSSSLRNWSTAPPSDMCMFSLWDEKKNLRFGWWWWWWLLTRKPGQKFMRVLVFIHKQREFCALFVPKSFRVLRCF